MPAGSGPIVVALGGNAIARPGDDGTITAQYRRARTAMARVGELVARGHQVALTHGNGPVVGSIVLRGELASAEVPPMPLFIDDADSAGGIGLMLQQTLGNELTRRHIDRCVATLVCQVAVDPADEAFARPTKPIGGFYSKAQAATLRSERGWTMREQVDGRFRRVVASPLPLSIIEWEAVRALLDANVIPIAAGGGGVPVVRCDDGTLIGIDAVVDKDWSSAVLARAIGAQSLVICMEADAVYLDWETDSRTRIEHLGVAEAAQLLASCSLAEGSIAPKVAAAREFAVSTGQPAILCATEDLTDALDGRAGTRISG